MAQADNRFSVRAEMYTKRRARLYFGKPQEVRGPWKPTVAEAVQAYKDMLEKKQWLWNTVFNPFVAEKQDARGIRFTRNEEHTPGMRELLARMGLRVVIGPA